MGHKIGDAVRLRPGSDLHELLEPWADLTGRVAGVYDDCARIAVDYPAPFEGYTFAVLATEYVPDLVSAEAPY